MMHLTLAPDINLSKIVTDAKTTELELNIVIMLASSDKPMSVFDAIHKVRVSNRPFRFVLDRYFCNAIATLVSRKVLVYV